jgi:Lrp/AsnC family leucine-responsive transcriptional regulator
VSKQALLNDTDGRLLAILQEDGRRSYSDLGATDLTPEFAAIPEVEECHYIAGAADYILKIRARDVDHLGATVRRVQSTQHVFSTATDVVFSTGFEGRPLAINRDAPATSETGRRGSA